MLPEFKRWDEKKNGDGPALIVFSDADDEANRGLGFSSPVVHDPSFTIASTLGMFGTPSAVLISSDGKFASEVAVGEPNIWALIGRK